MENDINLTKESAEILYDKLNEHGFIFQEKCAEELRENTSQTNWMVAKTEYPVSSEIKNTRIDIILHDVLSYPQNGNRIFAIVECKKVNPIRGYWLFGQPISLSNRDALVLHIKRSSITGGEPSLSYNRNKIPFEIHSILVDNWWLQVSKKGNKGKYESSPQPIEDSLLQVCIGVSGLSKEISMNMMKYPQESSAVLVPIIITSAPLYYAEYNLIDADLVSGYINKNKVKFNKIEWIQINYPASPTIFFNKLKDTSIIDSFTWLRKENQSSMYIVNSKSMIKFFSNLHLW
ncbi:MAG: hypothetical protein JW845_02330 [Dehalococcoidales bacterium]|nr:hypothetical protein [Dehalococcoidales bacterium]